MQLLNSNDDKKSISCLYTDIAKENIAIALGNGPPPSVQKVFKDDINDVVVAVVTPDSFVRDFSGVDIGLGSIMKQLLMPYVEVNGEFVIPGNADAKCAFNSKIIGLKLFKSIEDDNFAKAIVESCVLNGEEAKLLRSRLINSGGPVMVVCLRGKSGFGKQLRRRVGPMDNLQGGSLSARASSVNCIRASFAGDGCEEPGALVTKNRAETYKLLAHCFVAEELSGLEEGNDVSHPLLQLFPSSLPPSLVMFTVSIVKKLPR